MNPRDQRAESWVQKSMKIALQEKGFLRWHISNLVHKFIPMPQVMKIPNAKSAMDEEWKKLETTPAWNLESQEQEGGYSSSTKRQRESPLCHVDGHMSPQKMRIWTQTCRSTKAESCSGGDIVEDDSGAYAVFFEQGSSASQIDRCKIMDVIARLPGCNGQAADAVSALPKKSWEDARRWLKIPKSECPDVWIRFPRHKMAEIMGSIEDPVVLLQRNWYGHPLAELLWERQFEHASLELEWEKVSNWECMFVPRKWGLFLSKNVGAIKSAGKKQNLSPMWTNWRKNVDIDEPTSFLDHMYLRCTQRECKPNETIIEQYTKMFGSHISAGATDKLLGWQRPHAQTVVLSYDMEGHAEKCVERYCELANKKVEQLHEVSHPCLDDHQFNQEELDSVVELSEVCSQIVLTCLYLARIEKTWHFYGEWTNLQEQSQNWLEHVTDD